MKRRVAGDIIHKKMPLVCNEYMWKLKPEVTTVY